MSAGAVQYAFHKTPAVVHALQEWEVSVLDRLLSMEPLGEVVPKRKYKGKGGAR